MKRSAAFIFAVFAIALLLSGPLLMPWFKKQDVRITFSPIAGGLPRPTFGDFPVSLPLIFIPLREIPKTQERLFLNIPLRDLNREFDP